MTYLTNLAPPPLPLIDFKPWTFNLFAEEVSFLNKTRMRSQQVFFKFRLSLKVSTELKFNIHCFDLVQAELGPVHLDLFQLDVAQSVVDCTLSCFLLLCTTCYVGRSVSLSVYLVLCMSFFGVSIWGSLTISYFEWIFVPSSSYFSFSLSSSCSFCLYIGCESGCFTPPFSNMPWFIFYFFFRMCTKTQRLVSWHFAIYYWFLAGSVFHGTEG